MVTGVRIARGASMKASESAEWDIKAKGEGDASSQGLPIKAGAEANASRSHSEDVRAEKLSDFVFAYRLNEITWHGWVSQKPYTHGETAALGGSSGEDEEDNHASIEYEGYELERIKDKAFDGDLEDSTLTVKCSQFVE